MICDFVLTELLGIATGIVSNFCYDLLRPAQGSVRSVVRSASLVVGLYVSTTLWLAWYRWLIPEPFWIVLVCGAGVAVLATPWLTSVARRRRRSFRAILVSATVVLVVVDTKFAADVRVDCPTVTTGGYLEVTGKIREPRWRTYLIVHALTIDQYFAYGGEADGSGRWRIGVLLGGDAGTRFDIFAFSSPTANPWAFIGPITLGDVPSDARRSRLCQITTGHTGVSEDPGQFISTF